MKTVKFTGTMENAYGKVLAEKLPFEGEFDAYENLDEVRAAGEYPKDSEILDFVNGKVKANARQKSMNAALQAAGISKPTLEDPQVQLATIIKALIAGGRDEATATKLAEDTLGVKKA
jgi:hypothetical protein